MSRATPNTQGTLDDLCGLYALVHFLRELRDAENKFIFGTYLEHGSASAPEPSDRSRDAFWYVLDAAQRLGMLSPDYILQGYPAGHLVAIFNRLRDELGLAYTAAHFSDLAKLGKKHSFVTIARSVLEDPRSNAVLAQWNNHYYMSRSFDGGFLVVEDSAVATDRRQTLSPAILRDLRLSYCLAILEDSSAIVRSLEREVWQR